MKKTGPQRPLQAPPQAINWQCGCPTCRGDRETTAKLVQKLRVHITSDQGRRMLAQVLERLQ